MPFNKQESDTQRKVEGLCYTLESEILTEKEGKIIEELLNDNKENLIKPCNDEIWKERMKKVRVVEFWTTNPNHPPLTREEKIEILSNYRSGDSAIFSRRLGSYHLPENISDEDLLVWDGKHLAN